MTTVAELIEKRKRIREDRSSMDYYVADVVLADLRSLQQQEKEQAPDLTGLQGGSENPHHRWIGEELKEQAPEEGGTIEQVKDDEGNVLGRSFSHKKIDVDAYDGAIQESNKFGPGHCPTCGAASLGDEDEPEECKHKFRGYSVYPTTEYKDKGGNPLRLFFCELCGEVKDEKGDVIEPSTGKATKEKIEPVKFNGRTMGEDMWNAQEKINEIIAFINNYLT